MPTAPDIADCIHQNLAQYFRDLNGETPCGVYDMVLAYVLRECGGNQSKAADMLGLNRNTLRKKLLQHQLID